MYIRGLIPRIFAELAEAVPIDQTCRKTYSQCHGHIFMKTRTDLENVVQTFTKDWEVDEMKIEMHDRQIKIKK